MSPQTSPIAVKSQPSLFNGDEFALRLRQERGRTGLNQKDFGSRVGVGLQTQSRYETGQTQPDAEYLANLAALGLDVFYILTGERLGARPLDRDVSEVVTNMLLLPPELRETVLTLSRSLVSAAQAGDRPTMHDRRQDFRGEDRR